MNQRRLFLKSASLLTASLTLPTNAKCMDQTLWDEEVDVLIIGSGFAGLSAALNLKKQGVKRVIVLEKMTVIGGNSAVNGGWLAIPKNPLQISMGIEDSPEKLVQNQLREAEGMGSKANLMMIANHALDVYHLCLEVGVEFRKGYLSQAAGHDTKRIIRVKNGVGGDITTRLYTAGQKAGIEYRLQNYVDDFIYENEKIQGVVVYQNSRWPEKNTGVIKRIKVNKAVICAAGGFAKNKVLRQIFQPALDPTLDCTNARGATGEIMLTAMSHGALPVHLDQIQTGHWGSPDERGFGWSVAFLSIYWKEGIAVGTENGKRFMNERGGRKYCSELILKHRNPDGSPRYPTVFGAYNKNKTDPRVTRAIRDGIAWTFNSIEELSAHFKIPLKELKNTIAKYNSDFKKGIDSEFGKPFDQSELLKPPFVASRVWPKVHYCMGGLKTTPYGQVIGDKTLQPIDKLYAIGEISGGNHGASRLSSTSCLEALAMGIVSAKNIVKGEKV